jgi:NADH-quinone oxidoreductase subunit J
VTALDVVVGALGVLAVTAGVLVVMTRHLVHAALYLVVALAAVAGVFLALSAEFLAWVQILIYVGAVVVLLLFGIMLTRAPIGPLEGLSRPRQGVAIVVALASGAGLLGVLLAGFGDAEVDLSGPAAGAARTAGDAIFRTWVLPFEVISLLLLAALIGAIALSKGDSAQAPEDDHVPDEPTAATSPARRRP